MEKTIQAVIFGLKQKKRKRDDLDWDSYSLDESSKRRKQIIKERRKQFKAYENEEVVLKRMRKMWSKRPNSKNIFA